MHKPPKLLHAELSIYFDRRLPFFNNVVLPTCAHTVTHTHTCLREASPFGLKKPHDIDPRAHQLPFRIQMVHCQNNFNQEISVWDSRLSAMLTLRAPQHRLASGPQQWHDATHSRFAILLEKWANVHADLEQMIRGDMRIDLFLTGESHSEIVDRTNQKINDAWSCDYS